ncbi:MAG: outer membrane beta-barrel family protein [Bacteroidaceae bacterium]|nr:outer membrane beta-barrel family protein [Bacteroidaceae bacterium]
MKRTTAIILATLLTANVFGQQKTLVDESPAETKVEGTEMARLPFVIDVLKQLPKVIVSDNDISVVGRGVPAIYIENRKVTELTELSQIAANKVSSIKVITQPGAEYGKDVQSVIVINTIKENKDGFRLSETMRLDLTDKLAVNNQIRLGWKHNNLILGTFFAFNEENRNFEKNTFTRKYDAQQNQMGEDIKGLQHPDIYKQRWTGRLTSSYKINDDHNVALNYSYNYLRINRTFTPESMTTNRTPEKRHDIDMEYTGKIGNWNLNIGNNSFATDIDNHTFKPASIGNYLQDEFEIRTYAKASTPLWKGSLQVGAEHDYDYMDVDKHDDTQMSSDFMKKFGGIHAVNTDQTLAAFVSTTQNFGNWTVEGGLRYEHRTSIYEPCEDDGLMNYLDYWVNHMDMLRVDPESTNPIARLFLDGHLKTNRDFLYPTLKIATKLGKSSFALLHTQSSVRPYLGLTRLTIKDLENAFVEDRLLVTEKIATTSLNWNYLWTDLTATYTRYSDPICSTLDGSVKYNAPDYDALDVNATLSPKFGVWSPVLNVNMHKQWFDMPLANGKDKLHEMLFKVSMNNTVTLPGNWLILLTANWHSKGGERNVYYYTPNLSLNSSVQKEFPRQRLTLTLSATNILRDSYFDVTRYTQAYNGLSEGVREQDVRMVSLTVNYKI